MRTATAFIALVFLFGCHRQVADPAPPPDPRNGPVDTRLDGCFLGKHCFYDYKQCFGPDLLLVIDAYSDNPIRRWVKDSKECTP